MKSQHADKVHGPDTSTHYQGAGDSPIPEHHAGKLEHAGSQTERSI